MVEHPIDSLNPMELHILYILDRESPRDKSYLQEKVGSEKHPKDFARMLEDRYLVKRISETYEITGMGSEALKDYKTLHEKFF
jgi:hypothetical protein